jgi:hypothetical protein
VDGGHRFAEFEDRIDNSRCGDCCHLFSPCW